MENNEAYTEALKRIEACKAEQSLTLDLSGLGLTAIAAEVAECRWIETLNLSHNQITKIEGLQQLVDLQQLDLSDNEINKIEGLDHLVNLQELHLTENVITEIAGLEKLANLKMLSLHKNLIKNIAGLEKLKDAEDRKLLDCFTHVVAQQAGDGKALPVG